MGNPTFIDRFELDFNVFARMKRVANRALWNGKDMDAHFESCRWQWQKYDCVMVFTKETGYHSSGWWKNPLYERCWHLSLSFQGGKNKSATDKIIKGIFGDYRNLIWIEPPYSETGKKLEVWHYRLFCDEHWQPIKPVGEVYSAQFTERGWKSFSEKNYNPAT